MVSVSYTHLGHLIMPLAKKHKVPILPVDSEHSAIFQSMNGEDKKQVSKILLTASGGPFRGRSRQELAGMRAEDALKHPNLSLIHISRKEFEKKAKALQ